MWKTLTLACVLSFVALPAFAQPDGFGAGIRAGASFLTEDVNDETTSVTFEGNTGPLVSAQVFYRGVNYWTAGFAFEWEQHSVDFTAPGVSEIGIGDVNTYTLLPYVEVRPWNGTLVPYGIVGVGVNINTFSEDPVISPLEFDPDTTLAVRVGGGVDYFVMPRLAVNAEVGWKYNSGDVTLTAPGVTLGEGDFDVNAVSFLVGVRTFF